jgi:hypothetical protein
MQTFLKAMRVRPGGNHHQAAASVVGGGPQASGSRCRCLSRVRQHSAEGLNALSQAQQRRLSGTSHHQLGIPHHHGCLARSVLLQRSLVPSVAVSIVSVQSASHYVEWCQDLRAGSSSCISGVAG